MKYFVLLFSICELCTWTLSGQCPDKDFLWHRIIYLRDSSKIPLNDQKEELMKYLAKMQNCSYKNDSAHALLLQRIGFLYSADKDFVKAIQYTKESMNIIYKNLSSLRVNPKHLVKSYNNLRIFYDSLKSVKSKNEATDSCIALAVRLKSGYEFASPLLQIRTFGLLEAGDYYKCIEYADLGETICRSEPAYAYNLNYYIISKVNALIQLKEFDEAQHLLQKAITEYQKTGDKNFLGSFYAFFERISEEKNDEKNALQYLKKSIYYSELTKNLTVCSSVLNNTGYLLYFNKLKKYDVALKYYYKALKNADASLTLIIYENIANVFVREGVYDSAFYFFQKAFDQIRPGINEADLVKQAEQYINGSVTEYLTDLVLDKADAYLRFYKLRKETKYLDKAINSYKVIDQLFDRIKTLQSEIRSKLFWRNHIHRLYENAAEACFLRNNHADAFYFFEKSRSVLLSDQLNEQHLLGEEDILKQSQLKREILIEERELSNTGKFSTHYNDLQTELFNSKQKLEQLQQLIKINNPLYYQSFVDSNFITIKDVQQDILKDHEAIIEILSGDSAVYVFVITPRTSNLQKISKKTFDSLSVAFVGYLSNPGLLNGNFNAFTQVSNQLYRLIFQNNNLPAGRIIISPDGHYFPFEAMITSITNQTPTYLVEDHAVSYTYSARYLLNSFTNTSGQDSHTFLGIAPLKYANDMNLPELTGSNYSLRQVKNYFRNATNLIGAEASKNNFLQGYYKYKIIQLYTHATDSGYAGEPMIYFSDSILLLSDLIYQNKPVTKLIVLSACETAGGKLYNGEGVFSFNRQFAALGIPSSVCNLWQVDNLSTYKLTELFYKYVADGLPLDLALQKAKKELSKNSENKLPYYWAASILVGQTNAVHSQDSSWKWLGLIILLLILGFWNERKWLKQTS